jgi:hypothetical protein
MNAEQEMFGVVDSEKLIPPRGSIFTALCRVGVGSIPHLYLRNLTPDKTGLPEGGHTFEEFVQIANCLPFPFNGTFCR